MLGRGDLASCTDLIDVYYSITPEDSELDKVAKKHADLVESTIKSPFIRSKPVGGVIASEKQEVSDG